MRGLEPGRDYVIKHTTRTTRARITALDYRLDVNTLHRDKTATAFESSTNLGRISLRTQVRCCLDEYTRNASTGSFILIDPDTNGRSRRAWYCATFRRKRRARTPCGTIHWSLRTRPRGRTVWLTGLSVPASRRWRLLVERKLLENNVPAYVLDGEQPAPGLNADLASAWPTVPRTCAGWRMCNAARRRGHVVLVPVISPLTEHREMARKYTARWLGLHRGVGQRADDRYQHNVTGVGEQRCHMRQPAQFLGTSAMLKPRSAFQALAQVVAVENVAGTLFSSSFRSTNIATDDLPAPDKPVNHTVRPRGRCSAVTNELCRTVFGLAACAETSRNTMPAATVPLVSGSMRMNEPVLALRLYSSSSNGTCVRSEIRPSSLSFNAVASCRDARC